MDTNAETRTKRVAFRLTVQELSMLREVARETGIALSDVLRMAIREAHARLRRKATT